MKQVLFGELKFRKRQKENTIREIERYKDRERSGPQVDGHIAKEYTIVLVEW